MKRSIIIVFALLLLFQTINAFVQEGFTEDFDQFSETSQSGIPNVEGDWQKWKRFGNRGRVETNRLSMSGNILRKKLLEHPLIPPGNWSNIADNFDFNKNAFTRPDGWWDVTGWQLIVKNKNLLIEEYYGVDGSFYRFEWRRE